MSETVSRRKWLGMAFYAASGALATSSCGTLIYPERRGGSGRIDPMVVIMDGLLCLVFVLPGVIAFAVDFTTGAIYTDGYSKLEKYDVLGGSEDDYCQVLAQATGTKVQFSELMVDADKRGELSVGSLRGQTASNTLKRPKFIKDIDGKIIRCEVV